MSTTSRRSIPFQGLTMRQKQNLAIAALLAFNLLFFGWQLLSSEVFFGYGGDYLAFWSSGYVANTQGYKQVYNLQALEDVQRSLLQGEVTFAPLPVAFLPVFIIPFQALALLKPVTSYWVWTLINLIVFIVYLYFVFIRDKGQRLQPRLLLMMLVSLPFLFTLIEGQINVWLVIFVGEFMRAYFDDKPLRAGFWLGGLMWKPQTLVLFIPFLFFTRAWKVIGGVALTTFTLFFVSLLLGGWQALLGLLKLWLNFAEGLPTNSPENMMNWRMLGVHLGNLDKTLLGWGIVISGMIFTGILAINLWRGLTSIPEIRKQSLFAQVFGWVILGTLAATCAFTWHSHLHMGMLLIPAIVYLCVLGEFENRWLNIWLFLPPITLFFAFLLGVLVQNPAILVAGQPGGFLMGFGGLFINVLLLIVSFRRTRVLTR